MRVNGDISDIFFNTLHDAAEYDSQRRFTGYNHEKLRDAAGIVLRSLERLGVEVPTVDDLTNDFYGRV